MWRIGFVLLLCVLSAARLEAAIYISGRVVIEGSQTPAPGVTVSLLKKEGEDPLVSSQSLQNGAYVIAAPAAGSYRLMAKGKDYQSYERTVEVPAGGLGSLDLPVSRLPALKVQVILPNGKPAAEGAFAIWWTASWPGHENGADPVLRSPSPEGLLEIPEPEPGSHPSFKNLQEMDIGVRSETSGCGEVVIHRWPEGPVTVQLEKGEALSGEVVDEEGKPVKGAYLTTVRNVEGRAGFCYQGQVDFTTGDSGKFKLDSLFPGKYTVLVNIPGAGTHFRMMTLPLAEGELRLSPADDEWPEILERRPTVEE